MRRLEPADHDPDVFDRVGTTRDRRQDRCKRVDHSRDESDCAGTK